MPSIMVMRVPWGRSSRPSPTSTSMVRREEEGRVEEHIG